MNKTGIVMKVENKKACIMTDEGEFINVSIKGKSPDIGEVYTGRAAVSILSPKRAAAAAAVLLIVLSSSLGYTYNAEAASIIFDGNPEIRLSVNRWNRIIKAEALNEDGKKVLSSVSIKNKNLSTGLNAIVSEAEKENLIAASSSNGSDKSEEIKVLFEDSKTGIVPNLDEFQRQMKQDNINVFIGNLAENSNVKRNNKNNENNSNKKDDSENNSNINNASKENQTIKMQTDEHSMEKNHNNSGNSVNMKKSSSTEEKSSEFKQSTDNKAYKENDTDHHGSDNGKSNWDKNSENKEKDKDKSRGNH